MLTPSRLLAYVVSYTEHRVYAVYNGDIVECNVYNVYCGDIVECSVYNVYCGDMLVAGELFKRKDTIFRVCFLVCKLLFKLIMLNFFYQLE